MARVLICDDSAQARATLRATLAGSPGIEIVGEAEDGVEAIAASLELAPDVVLIDGDMPVMDGVAATKCLRLLAPSVRVIAVTGSDDPRRVEELRRAGATECFRKGVGGAELERAIARAERRAA
jgi:DNA-binding NarL/FixJ family response regulator